MQYKESKRSTNVQLYSNDCSDTLYRKMVYQFFSKDQGNMNHMITRYDIKSDSLGYTVNQIFDKHKLNIILDWSMMQHLYIYQMISMKGLHCICIYTVVQV